MNEEKLSKLVSFFAFFNKCYFMFALYFCFDALFMRLFRLNINPSIILILVLLLLVYTCRDINLVMTSAVERHNYNAKPIIPVLLRFFVFMFALISLTFLSLLEKISLGFIGLCVTALFVLSTYLLAKRISRLKLQHKFISVKSEMIFLLSFAIISFFSLFLICFTFQEYKSELLFISDKNDLVETSSPTDHSCFHLDNIRYDRFYRGKYFSYETLSCSIEWPDDYSPLVVVKNRGLKKNLKEIYSIHRNTIDKTIVEMNKLGFKLSESDIDEQGDLKVVIQNGFPEIPIFVYLLLFLPMGFAIVAMFFKEMIIATYYKDLVSDNDLT